MGVKRSSGPISRRPGGDRVAVNVGVVQVEKVNVNCIHTCGLWLTDKFLYVGQVFCFNDLANSNKLFETNDFSYLTMCDPKTWLVSMRKYSQKKSEPTAHDMNQPRYSSQQQCCRQPATRINSKLDANH